VDQINASKENVRHAIENLKQQERFMNEYAYKTILSTLEACERKVPTEAAYAKEKERRKK
jgi:hypothetical protein